MNVDVLIDPFGAGWPAVRDTAVAAEMAGFDGVWTWDHLAGSVHGAADVLECWTTLSALAATVGRLAIGPMVLNVANRDPAMLAIMATTLQRVSEGRLLLGLGAGGGHGTPYAAEQVALGRPVGSDPERRQAVEDAVATLHRVWAGTVAGRPGYGRPDPVPPVVIGAFGPKMAALAGRIGDGINTQAGHPRLAEMVATARLAHADAGRLAEPFLVTVFTGLDPRWLRRDSRQRQRLEEVGVDRLVLLVGPNQVDDLRRAAPLLAGGAS